MKGDVVYLYAFDVANEIVTARVREILSRQPAPYEIRLDQTVPRDMPLYRPLAIEPPPLPETVAGQPVRLQVRVYDVGVVSVVMRVAFEAERLSDLFLLHEPKHSGGQSLDQVARRLCDEVCKGLQESMIKSSPSGEPEAYTVFCLTDLGGERDTGRWLADQRRAVAGLLSQTDPDRLSEAQVADVLRLQRSFENSDLTIIDWDAALVVDLAGYTDDVLYVLELANLQLEEFRMMDLMLDRRLAQAYDDVERRRGFALFGRHNAVLEELRRQRIDVTQLADQVSHITKFIGDWYLARVYLAARERFHLEQWRTSVEQRLAQLDRLYSVFHDEINEKRMLWLEAAIVILFIIDLIGIFWLK
jgi:hypothetical protein